MAFSLEVLAKIEIDTSQLLIQKFSEEKKYISVPLMKPEVEQYSNVSGNTTKWGISKTAWEEWLKVKIFVELRLSHTCSALQS